MMGLCLTFVLTRWTLLMARVWLVGRGMRM